MNRVKKEADGSVLSDQPGQQNVWEYILLAWIAGALVDI